MRNIQVRISVEMLETQDPVTSGNDPERMDDGSFSVILGHEAEFDISRLENATLRTTYPALRTAISEHLGAASKKGWCLTLTYKAVLGMKSIQKLSKCDLLAPQT